MGRAAARVRGEAQKNIVRLIDGLSGKYSGWAVWQDFIVMSGISIANVVNGPFRESREAEFMSRAQKYSETEMGVFAKMLAGVVAAMEGNPDQDFLGELFMSLGLGDEWKGQFFTPYSICRCMAEMQMSELLLQGIERDGWVSVNDPACGAGGLLMAFANVCRAHEINYQTEVLFVAQDLDFLAGMMCYIQLSLMGCSGYVVMGDTLAHPSTCLDDRGLIPTPGLNVWYTPMYHRNIWAIRQMIAKQKKEVQYGKA